MLNVNQEKIVVLDRGKYTSCTINLFGATVTSWRIRNREMIFVSRESHFTGLTHIRGGIKFAFPVIDKWSHGPTDGFAQNLMWTMIQAPEKAKNGDISATFNLNHNAYTLSLWNYKFSLHYTIILREKRIDFVVGVENTSKGFPLEFAIMLHSLMRVPNVSKSEIVGFKGYSYKDCLTGKKSLRDDSEVLTISKRVNRMYYNVQNDITFSNTVGGGTMRISSKNTTDVVVWNPWIEQSLQMHDLGDDEYQHFIAIEDGVTSKNVRLLPLCCWSAFHTFEYIEPVKVKKKINACMDFYDLFDGYC